MMSFVWMDGWMYARPAMNKCREEKRERERVKVPAS